MIGAERVLEAGVGGAGIDKEGVAELPDIAKPLDGGRIQYLQRRTVQPDVVPQRVADDLESGSQGPAAATACSTWAAYCEKLSRNIFASFLAWAS